MDRIIDISMDVVIGKKKVTPFFWMHISPGSRPSHGIFPPNVNMAPNIIRKIPSRISIFPNALMSGIYSSFLFLLFLTLNSLLLGEQASAIILAIHPHGLRLLMSLPEPCPEILIIEFQPQLACDVNA